MVVVFDIETLGSNAFQHQILLIGMRVEGKTKQWRLWKEKDELSMISKCLRAVEKIPLFEMIVGYNNLKFDVPFIAGRLSVHGKWSADLWDLLYHERKWFDLYQFLGNDFRRLSFWLDKLGIERKYEDILGREVALFYSQKKYAEIEQRNKDDLETSEQLYLKLRREFPQLLLV